MNVNEETVKTRMHSSRMRTARSSSRGGCLLPGGSPCQGGVPPSCWGSPCRGVPLSGGCLLPGGSPCGGASFLPGGSPCRGLPPSCQGESPCRKGRGLPAGGVPPSREGGLLDGRPPLWTEWQTGVKILPCPKLRLRAVTNCKSIPLVWRGLTLLIPLLYS